MALYITFGKKSIDLLEITVENYPQLDKQPKLDREYAVKHMVNEFSNEDLLYAIEHLSQICFEVNKVLFIRKGPSSFLADMIKAYVDKYDGDRFVRTYYDAGKDGLRDFKFSKQSTAVFYLLWHEALIRAYEDRLYIEYLPINISNKIWQAMIMDRVDVSSVTPTSLMIISATLQELAHDSQLLTTILMSNLDIEQAYNVSPTTQDESLHRVDSSRPRSLSVTEKGFFANTVKKVDSSQPFSPSRVLECI